MSAADNNPIDKVTDSSTLFIWEWFAPSPWFGVVAGFALSVILLQLRGRRIDRLSGFAVAVIGVLVSPLIVAALVGVFAGLHPKRLAWRWRAGIAANSAVFSLVSGHGIWTYFDADLIPYFHIAAVVGCIAAGRALRYLRLDGRDEQRAFNSVQRRRLMAKSGHRCVYCGVGELHGGRLQADHVVPWSLGGKTKVSNGQMLCGRDNRMKTNKSDAEARREFKKRYGVAAGSYAARLVA